MANERVYICEACGRFLDEHHGLVVEAAKLFPGGGDVLESPHVFFHPGCYSAGSRRYRVIDRRTTIDAALRRLGDR